MRKTFFVITVIFCMCLFASCSALKGHCITVGGAYRGVDGSISYCFDNGESAKVGTPVFVDGAGGKNIVLTETQAQILNELVMGGAKNTKAKALGGAKMTPFELLMLNIKEKGKRK